MLAFLEDLSKDHPRHSLSSEFLSQGQLYLQLPNLTKGFKNSKSTKIQNEI
jgi:hypothetical protein